MNLRAEAIAIGWLREDLRRNDDAPNTPPANDREDARAEEEAT